MVESILPVVSQLEYQDTTAANEITDLGKGYKYNYPTRDFTLVDGKLVSLDGDDAIRGWIEKILRTDKFKFRVYDKGGQQDEYGVSIMELFVGHIYPQEYLEAELKREITEAVLRHPVLSYLSDWLIAKEDVTLHVTFTVHKKDATTLGMEVTL